MTAPRLLGLHLRARGVPLTAALAAAVVLLCWWWGEALADSPRYGPAGRVYVVLTGPLLVAGLLAPTLAGADEDLERSTALPWRRVRLAHVAMAALAPAAALALTGLREPTTYGAVELARNAAGYTGLVALTATLLGAQLAWLPACSYTALAFFLHARSPSAPPAWAWALDRGAGGEPIGIALALLLAGAAVYALREAPGQRHRGN